MITTGYATDIVDVTNGTKCSALATFPDVGLYGAVGANIAGTLVVCGGYSYETSGVSEKCYRFTNNEWEEFASMKEGRKEAAGVKYGQTLHVFGGKSNSILSSTEIINVDGGVSDGPKMPTFIYLHAITAISDTVSILSGGYGGYTFSKSPKTWYYNHETKVFSSGPNLLEARISLGSATNVDRVTKARIPVVTGGYKGFYNV